MTSLSLCTSIYRITHLIQRAGEAENYMKTHAQWKEMKGKNQVQTVRPPLTGVVLTFVLFN
jgi:hypothetical protein